MRSTVDSEVKKGPVDEAYDRIKDEYQDIPFDREIKPKPVYDPYIEDLPPIVLQYLMPVELIKPKEEARLKKSGDVFRELTPNRKHVREFRQAAEEIGKLMTGETSTDDVPPVVANYGLGDFMPSRKPGRPRKADRVKPPVPPAPVIPKMPPTFDELKSFGETPKENKPGDLSIDVYLDMIKTARSHGVAKMKFRGLELEFFPDHGDKGHKADDDLPKTDNFPPMSPASDTKPAVDQDLLDDMRRTQLLLDDPMAFEQEVITAHLEGEQ